MKGVLEDLIKHKNRDLNKNVLSRTYDGATKVVVQEKIEIEHVTMSLVKVWLIAADMPQTITARGSTLVVRF